LGSSRWLPLDDLPARVTCPLSFWRTSSYDLATPADMTINIR
jgi:hypothetical protein